MDHGEDLIWHYLSLLNQLLRKSIDVFNNGNHTRDFTYVDDIVDGIIKILDTPASTNPNWNSDQPDPATSLAPWKIYNIGNNKPIKLMDYISALEKVLGKKAKLNFLPLQKGDVPDTHANVENLINKFNYKPSTSVVSGVTKFVEWYKRLLQNMKNKLKDLRLAVIGLGYVGLPLALEFSKKRSIVGFDTNEKE